MAITEEELGAIEARANAATLGPWLTPKEVGNPYKVQIIDHEGCEIWPWREEEDMIFAYAARTDVPRLVAEVRGLKEYIVHLAQSYNLIVTEIADLAKD